MSEAIDQAVAALNEKLADADFSGSIKVEIADEGSIMIDGNTATAGDGDADCTMSADADTFRSMMEGDLEPTTAFMTGRLSIDGDMGAAMKLAAVLS